jgi:purine-nucleoside/S-methyl-5'-thioadenosine phosphorylase / adenosine deaminase
VSGKTFVDMSELIRIEHDNGVVTYQSPLLCDIGVPHGFTTRIGGVSAEPYASLNLASLVSDPDADANTRVAENFRRVRKAIECRQHIRVQVNQVHGHEVWQPPAKPIRPVDAPKADAIVTDRAGLLLMVRVADCVPVLLSDKRGRVVSAVHAGWRGVIGGVVGCSVESLMGLGGVGGSAVVAAVGPCIQAGHFEVGREVVSSFEDAGLGNCIREDPRWEKPHIDLSAVVLHQLERAGIPADQIDTTDRCTFADVDEFFSHRRDKGKTGRQAALIAVSPH